MSTDPIEPKVEFHVHVEGQIDEICKALAVSDQRRDGRLSVGPLCRAFLDSKERVNHDDEDDGGEVTGEIPVTDAETLARVVAALAAAKLTSWSVEAEVTMDEGVYTSASLMSAKWGKPGRARVNTCLDRKRIVGAVVERVREACRTLDRAINDYAGA